jgi:hypothetical protein
LLSLPLRDTCKLEYKKIRNINKYTHGKDFREIMKIPVRLSVRELVEFRPGAISADV